MTDQPHTHPDARRTAGQLAGGGSAQLCITRMRAHDTTGSAGTVAFRR